MLSNRFAHKWWALIGLSLLSFTAFLDYTIVTTALPFIQRDLHASVLELQWVMNIFGMILCMFMIAAGHAGDRLGRKRVFFFGFFLFGIAAIGAGCSPTIAWLIFFRAIQGFSAAIIFTIGVSLLPQAFPVNEQTRAIGIFSAFNGAGLAIGPFLSGLLMTYLSWRWVFWVNIPIIIIGIACCAYTLQPTNIKPSSSRTDWTGFVLLAAGLGCLVYGLIQGEQLHWDLKSIGFIICGLISLILLFFIENKKENALLDFSLFKNISACFAILVCVAAGFITFVFMFFDPLYLEQVRHFSPLSIGLILLCVPVVQIIISLLFAKILIQVSLEYLILFALLTASIAAMCHAFFSPTINIAFVLFTLTLMGFTWGIANVGSITEISKSVPLDKMGNAIGTVFTFWNISGSIFLALASVIYHTASTQLENFMRGFYWMTYFAIIVLLSLFLLGLYLNVKRKNNTTPKPN